MTAVTKARWQAAAVAIGPAFLTAALLYHPFVARLRDTREVAQAIAADNTRWALAHLAVGIGFGLLLLSFLAVRSYLDNAGEQRWSPIAVPLLVMGTIFFTFLPAMEIAIAAAVRAGADAVAAQTELTTWFVPSLIAGAVTLGAGVLMLAAGIVRSRVFNRSLTRVIAGALVVGAITRFVPVGQALYVGAVATLIALIPIAAQMWSHVSAAEAEARPSFRPHAGGVR